MNMKDMIQRMTEIENSAKTKLNESVVAECGDMPAAPTNPGNPVTMSVTLNASGKEHVDDLLQMMKAAGLEKAEVQPQMMPMRQDMDRLGSIMRQSEMIEDDLDLDEYINEPDEMYMDQPEGGGINRRKGAYAAAQDGDNAMAVENIDPNEVRKLQSVKDLDQLKDLAAKMVQKTQMNPKKKMNLMRNINNSRTPDNVHGALWNSILGKEGLHAMGSTWNKRHESAEPDIRESLKQKLLSALNEKKAKPDFLDMDKDGNKKEPMKKAIKDKKKNPFKK